MKGMTLVVQSMARLVVGFVVLYSLYVVLAGHTGPGGGFSGGVMLMAGVVLLVLAFGGDATRELTAEWRCQLVSGLGGLVFMAAIVTLLRMSWYGTGLAHVLVPITDAVLAVVVAAGLTGVFLGLVVATRQAMPKEL